VGVPLGWLFLARQQVAANYIWNCDCILVTTTITVPHTAWSEKLVNDYELAVACCISHSYLMWFFKNDWQKGNAFVLQGLLPRRFFVVH
jgi:hypothetical protein